MEPIEIIGQILGGVAIILGLISYQMKTQGRIILMQALTGLVFVVQYLLLGAYTGMAMNLVGVVRCIVYYFRNKRGSNEKVTPMVFAVIMAIIGILTWNAWYSVFMFLGLVINTLCLAFSDPQKLRASVLVTCPLVLIYNVLIPSPSIGGIIYESVAIISAIIGIVRNKKKV